MVKEIQWAKPDWTIIYLKENRLCSFYNIVERNISIDNTEIRAAGINNVITPLEFRGKGYVTPLMKEAEHLIFEQLKGNLGLLLCADHMPPFFEKLG